MPVLRQPAAQARAQARPRPARRRAQGAPSARRRCSPRLKRDEIPGIRGDTRPYATIALVVAGLVGCLLWRTNLGGTQGDLIVFGQPGSEWWRLFTAAFTYDNVGYAMITLGTVGLFGWLLERRHGPFPVLALFIIGGVGGLAATTAIEPNAVLLGAQGGALALVCAWATPDLLTLRSGGRGGRRPHRRRRHRGGGRAHAAGRRRRQLGV